MAAIRDASWWTSVANTHFDWPPDASERRMVKTDGHHVILTTSFGPTAWTRVKLVPEVMPGMRAATNVHGHETERTSGSQSYIASTCKA